MRLVDSAEKADFVLVDDFSGPRTGPVPLLDADPTVALDADTAKPDVTVNAFGRCRPSPDYKIYVHSVRYSQQDAAALLAAMWKTDQRREATGSIR